MKCRCPLVKCVTSARGAVAVVLLGQLSLDALIFYLFPQLSTPSGHTVPGLPAAVMFFPEDVRHVPLSPCWPNAALTQVSPSAGPIIPARPSSWPPGPSYRAVPHAWAVSYFFGQCPSFMLTDLSSYFLFRRPLHRCPPQWARFRGPLMVSPNPSSCLQALAPRAVPRTRAVSSPQLFAD